MKITFLNSDKLATVEAKKEAKNHTDVCSEDGSYQCDCGESFCVNVVDLNTLTVIHKFVECEHCNNM